jgi:hypothetical protein
VATREQITARLDAGCSYEEVAREFAISAGLAHLIVTGIPADPQRAASPTENPHVVEWVRRRALGDNQMQQAAALQRRREASS